MKEILIAMYKLPTGNVSFPLIEEEMIRYWKDNKIFERSVAKYKKEIIFYDGPPFPTGAPHYGTIFVSILKDSLARFFTMQGCSVPRRWGWDCHGLPIENAVEKQLGIKEKTEIEKKLGVKAFNDACRKLVSDCNAAWREYIEKIGRWVDYDNAYRTLDVSYMESVLWVFKTCYDKGLIYKDYRVTPYCYHCETSLSFSDIRESDSTRPKQDPEIIVAFKAKDDIVGKPTFYLAWTTTPWTLISNLVLAVGADYEYAAVENQGKIYILAKALFERWKNLFEGETRIVDCLKGKELVGRKYYPIYDYFAELTDEGCFRILAADFVSLEEGVGIVHCAPAFGEDDYWLCKRNGIGVKNPVDAKGCFTSEIKEFAGRNVHEANKDVIRSLKEKGVLLLHRTLMHNYPHCWRCRTPVIYRAMDAWYFAVEKIKDKLLEKNEDINWVPDHVKHGRFGKWLEGARDWNISRSRYWGTPIPVWDCTNPNCNERVVLGSIEEIEKQSGIRLQDLHKEFMDEVTFKCKSCGSMMRRVPEVLDCWFESGSMPYGQCHYPFKNKEWFETHFPCDFIVEYPGQIRGWFYYMHVLSVALFNKISFKNCLVHGTLLAEDGSKFSKSKKNFTDPMELIRKYGADALRLYLHSSPAVVMDDLNFKDSGVEDQIKRVILPLWNAFHFFVTYANIDGFKGDPNKIPALEKNIDKWILAELYAVEKKVKKAFETFYLNHSLSPILDFIDDLTNWYIRQSRERFWAEGGLTKDKIHAYETLYYILCSLMKLLAPSAPFISDYIYRVLTNEDSVHLSKWPDIPESFYNIGLIEENKLARLVVKLGLSLRQKKAIRVRQPLKKLMLALPPSLDKQILDNQLDVIKNELNVKSIELIANPEDLAKVKAIPNPRLLGPKFGKDVQTIIKAAKAGQIKDIGEKIVVFEQGREWILDKNEIEIRYEGKDNAEVASEHGILVALDFSLTKELIEEGIANELNRIIQDMRKKQGYAISDRIKLNVEGDIQQEWKEFLAKQALAELTVIKENEADATTQETIEGRQFYIAISRLTSK